MNTKTTLSSHIPTLMDRWHVYKKGLKGLKFTDWVISSDYCLDDEKKLNDVITFTIFPYIHPQKIIAEINKYIPTDIKKIKDFSEETLNYLKNSPYFFNIAIILENRENFLKKNNLLEMSEQLISMYKQFSPNMQKDHKEDYLKITRFNQYLKQGHCSKRLLSTILFVSQYVSTIIEFLLIKEKGSNPFWCSDRDDIISFNNEIIYNFIQSQTHMLLKDRIKDYYIHFPEYPNNEFPFDPLIRIPNIICGALSSVKYIDANFKYDKEKHRELFVNVISDNPRLVVLRASFDEDGKETLVQHEYYNTTTK